jgi:hypothetical protein
LEVIQAIMSAFADRRRSARALSRSHALMVSEIVSQSSHEPFCTSTTLDEQNRRARRWNSIRHHTLILLVNFRSLRLYPHLFPQTRDKEMRRERKIVRVFAISFFDFSLLGPVHTPHPPPRGRAWPARVALPPQWDPKTRTSAASWDPVAGLRAALERLGRHSRTERFSLNGRSGILERATASVCLDIGRSHHLAHFSVSSAMNLPKSAGDPANTATPSSVRRFFMLGSTRAALCGFGYDDPIPTSRRSGGAGAADQGPVRAGYGPP